MATIKSYTDLEQSKKLAKILSIESADMCYIKHSSSNNPSWEFNEDFPPMILGNVPINEMTVETLPCWSIASLLGVMPQINEWFTPYGHKNDILYQFEPKICKIWEHNTIPSYKVTYGNRLFTDSYDNPVDACVAMIEKLNELNYEL